MGLSASEFIRGMLISIMSGPEVVPFRMFFCARLCFFVRRQAKKRIVETRFLPEIAWLECSRCQNQGREDKI